MQNDAAIIVAHVAQQSFSWEPVMHKVLFSTVSVIALGFASAAFASGSTSYDTQEGTGQTATIDQTGGTNDVVGTSGTPFDQNNGSGTGGNGISITQTGSYNSFGVSAASFQSGTTNAATIDQNGYNSGVVLQQTGTNNGSTAYNNWTNSGSGGIIVQDNTSDTSSIVLTQNGSDSIFDIGQGGYNNLVNATQIGTDQLYVRQGTSMAAYGGFGSSYETNSTVTVYQSGGGTGYSTNYASLAQGGGDSNQISVTQIGFALGADVNQNGSNNLFSSYQAGSGNMVGLPAAFVADTPITQTGTGNQYYNVQLGTNSTANGSQLGTDNYVSNYQSGNADAISGSQNGTNNQVYTWQTGGTDTLAYTQTGSNNFVSNSQSGSGNSVTIHQ